jgi:flagellin-like hook-associated protein FlgL
MGSFSILNNSAGPAAQNQLKVDNVNLSRALLRLSSGKRINCGADDAAGLQIADNLRAAGSDSRIHSIANLKACCLLAGVY